jgi:Glycosyl hydrolases family 15
LTTKPGTGRSGTRNWDYRFSWVRDACLTMDALWVAACPDEAAKFFAFLSTAAATSLYRGADLQIMFGVGGERDLSERVLPHLAGWRGSAPVRVGNGAWTQRQIDVYGELLAAVGRLRDQIGELDPATQAFLVAVADTAARRWAGKDQGIWEIRGAAQDFVYSKVMCWVALDRAIALAGKLGAEDRLEGWQRTRDDIHAAVLRHGWSQRAGAFTQAYGSDDLDASSLMMPIVWFLPATDPGVLATIDAIAERLTDERGLVYRYDTRGGADGLKAGRAPSCCVPSGWPRPWPWQASPRGHGTSSSVPSPTSTTSACWPKTSTRPPASCSATSPRPSATSGSSTPPGPSPRPSAGRQPASAADRPRPGLSASAAGFRHDPAAPQAGSARGMRGMWYRFAATFGRRREGYLTLVPLIGLTGGIAMDSVAAASGLLVVDGIAGCGEAGDDPRDAALGDARRRGGSGGVAPTVGSCDAGST